MQFTVHHYHYNTRLEQLVMAVSAEIQTALDGIRQTQSILKSLEAGLAVQTKMLADQGAQIADLQAQVAAGRVMSADDLAALAETNADIASVNTSLQADIPANTGAAGAGPAANP